MAEQRLKCAGCGKTYRAARYKPEKTYACRRCGDTLEPVSESDSKSKSQESQEHDDPLLGKQLGSYSILDKLGEGGMGAVYRAEHVGLQVIRAVKILPVERALRSPHAVQRFLREARAAAKLSHPNIVAAFNVAEVEGWHVIEMEYVDGESVQAQLKREGSLGVEEATRVALATAHALAAAHEQNIVHRDIKPANILVDRERAVKVADFGLAKNLDDDLMLTEEGRGGLGTPYFMSPEQIDAAPVDGRSDIYSLGATYFYLLTGEVPFKGDSGMSVMLKHKTEPAPDPRTINPSVPRSVCDIVDKAMAKDPKDRYQSCEELIAALEAALDGLDRADTSGLPLGLSDVRYYWRRFKRSRAAPVAAITGVVAGVIGLVLVVSVFAWGVGRASVEVTEGKTWTNPKDGSEMVFVRAGSFKMGSNERDDEKPIHDVHVDAFYIGKYEVTNRQFKKFVDANPQWGKGRVDSKYASGSYLKHWEGDTYPSDKADHPVVYVSWFAARAYCEWAGGRLPTEAEWEKACRAGSNTKYCFGDDESQLGEYAWYRDNSARSAHPVGEKKANAWGLYDMHGNVSEWCSSKYEQYPYKRDDGREDLSDTGFRRVARGGGWGYHGLYCRSVSRRDGTPALCSNSLGLRVCVSARAAK